MKNNDLAIVLENNIKNILQKDIEDFSKYCPRCNTKMKWTYNTLDNVPYMSVKYCPNCGFTPNIDDTV